MVPRKDHTSLSVLVVYVFSLDGCGVKVHMTKEEIVSELGPLIHDSYASTRCNDPTYGPAIVSILHEIAWQLAEANELTKTTMGRRKGY